MTDRNSIILKLILAYSLGLPSSVMAASHYLPDTNRDCWNNYNNVCYDDNASGGGSSSGGSGGGSISTDYQSCINAGYTIKSCPEGYAVDINERCPFGLGTNLYKACHSIAQICQDKGYTLTCAAGYEPDLNQTCNYDSVYVKCACARCLGYDYTLDEANSSGYVADGEPCQSCDEFKYKRKINPCTGFDYDTTNCGVTSCQTLSGDTCVSGSVLKYKECKACPTPSCGEGYWNLDSYWCNGALRCWLPKMN